MKIHNRDEDSKPHHGDGITIGVGPSSGTDLTLAGIVAGSHNDMPRTIVFITASVADPLDPGLFEHPDPDP